MRGRARVDDDQVGVIGRILPPYVTVRKAVVAALDDLETRGCMIAWQVDRVLDGDAGPAECEAFRRRCHGLRDLATGHLRWLGEVAGETDWRPAA